MIHLVGKPEGGSDARPGPDDEQPFQLRGLVEPGSGPAPAPAYPRDREPGFGSLSLEFEQLYSHARQASIPPEKPFRAVLLQAFYGVDPIAANVVVASFP